MKSTIFWDITPCSPLKVNRRFGGTYRLHLQGRRISRAGNQRERSACHLLPPSFPVSLFFDPEDADIFNETVRIQWKKTAFYYATLGNTVRSMFPSFLAPPLFPSMRATFANSVAVSSQFPFLLRRSHLLSVCSPICLRGSICYDVRVLCVPLHRTVLSLLHTRHTQNSSCLV
jgi:hypothetical protein